MRRKRAGVPLFGSDCRVALRAPRNDPSERSVRLAMTSGCVALLAMTCRVYIQRCLSASPLSRTQKDP
ncbi:MAG: hypothetical protein LBL66_09575 [Clostridiales bacterium]|nr:hypothetical protein [Clostridiales bacterium]